MRVLQLHLEDFELFKYYQEYKDAWFYDAEEDFKDMWREQGKTFWLRFLITFKGHFEMNSLAQSSEDFVENYSILSYVCIKIHRYFIETDDYYEANALIDQIFMGGDCFLKHKQTTVDLEGTHFANCFLEELDLILGNPPNKNFAFPNKQLMFILTICYNFATALTSLIKRWVAEKDLPKKSKEKLDYTIFYWRPLGHWQCKDFQSDCFERYISDHWKKDLPKMLLTVTADVIFKRHKKEGCCSAFQKYMDFYEVLASSPKPEFRMPELGRFLPIAMPCKKHKNCLVKIRHDIRKCMDPYFCTTLDVCTVRCSTEFNKTQESGSSNSWKKMLVETFKCKQSGKRDASTLAVSHTSFLDTCITPDELSEDMAKKVEEENYLEVMSHLSSSELRNSFKQFQRKQDLQKRLKTKLIEKKAETAEYDDVMFCFCKYQKACKRVCNLEGSAAAYTLQNTSPNKSHSTLLPSNIYSNALMFSVASDTSDIAFGRIVFPSSHFFNVAKQLGLKFTVGETSISSFAETIEKHFLKNAVQLQQRQLTTTETVNNFSGKLSNNKANIYQTKDACKISTSNKGSNKAQSAENAKGFVSKTVPVKREVELPNNDPVIKDSASEKVKVLKEDIAVNEDHNSEVEGNAASSKLTSQSKRSKKRSGQRKKRLDAEVADALCTSTETKDSNTVDFIASTMFIFHAKDINQWQEPIVVKDSPRAIAVAKRRSQDNVQISKSQAVITDVPEIVSIPDSINIKSDVPKNVQTSKEATFENSVVEKKSYNNLCDININHSDTSIKKKGANKVNDQVGTESESIVNNGHKMLSNKKMADASAIKENGYQNVTLNEVNEHYNSELPRKDFNSSNANKKCPKISKTFLCDIFNDIFEDTQEASEPALGYNENGGLGNGGAIINDAKTRSNHSKKAAQNCAKRKESLQSKISLNEEQLKKAEEDMAFFSEYLSHTQDKTSTNNQDKVVDDFLALLDIKNGPISLVSDPCKITGNSAAIQGQGYSFQQCAYCGKKESIYTARFKKCAICKSENFPNTRYYCSKTHQVEDWAKHQQDHLRHSNKNGVNIH